MYIQVLEKMVDIYLNRARPVYLIEVPDYDDEVLEFKFLQARNLLKLSRDSN